MLCAHLLLLIAACQFPEPTFSEFANTKILVELVATIKSWKQKRSANDIADDDENGDAHEEEKLWPLLSFLHHRLLRRQQQLEVLEEVEKTKQNQSCQRELSHYYYNRIEHADQQEEPNSEGWWTAQRQQYIGQPFAWRAVQEVFLHGGLLERRKANVLLFFGPSGYGKSELARRIAVALHGTEEVEAEGKLLMIHMPSYCTRDSIYSLVDPPAAHVGDGMLLSALLKQKDAVIILDEFEKSTADSIQNLWLSAFQKNGTIRSLKQKDRCVSTVETTFILTCNLCDDMIQQDRHAFLRATPSEQQQYTQRYIRQCKEKCTTLFGEPFVNRVDYFLPFVPYSEAERRQFVLLQLERILGYQTTKQRTLFVTHRFVDQLVKIVTTFHANKVEEVLKPLLIYMSSKKWNKAVLTATVMYVEDQEEAAAADGGDAPRVGFYDVHGQNTKVRFSLLPTVRGEAATEAHQGGLTYWEDFPGGKECVERWEKEVEELKQGKDKTPPPTAAAAPVERPKEVEDVIVNAPTSATGAVFQGNREEKEMELITEKEVQLHKELVAAKELLVQKDKEIALLKEKVLLLEKLVALLVCALLSCVLVLSFVVGLKLALLWLAFLFFVGAVVFHIPLSVLIGALSSFFRFLGPVKGSVLAVCLISWVWAGVKQRVYCA
ncbi:AAA domain (Cdc48 subfamily)/AAA domain (dynein-related subfamily), putative [Angomonas deanei]|uniref:AAA domain (Cdc48 subfamily)/AAA domain (Dynein-related subfamily), putative n=1 Tax=Angomonas deanei TaxID=59799 RepID=A0A7G2CF21_9TRYP|nr:AAA domain (Cdc48 subfamily)/AAA domain (dynein-related subfamily), putative [Angomonas deanei]